MTLPPPRAHLDNLPGPPPHSLPHGLQLPPHRFIYTLVQQADATHSHTRSCRAVCAPCTIPSVDPGGWTRRAGALRHLPADEGISECAAEGSGQSQCQAIALGCVPQGISECAAGKCQDTVLECTHTKGPPNEHQARTQCCSVIPQGHQGIDQ